MGRRSEPEQARRPASCAISPRPKRAYGYAWPEYKASADQLDRVKDGDGDGMPDWFEDQFGLDKAKADDAGATTLDSHARYTNLEMYLHYLVKDIVAAQNKDGNYTKLQ